MRLLTEYLSTKIKPSTIYATNDTIREIVKSEIDRLGFDADLNHIDVSEVTDFSQIFAAKSDTIGEPKRLGLKYKEINPDVSKWNTSKAKNLNGMFMNCRKFNCDLDRWDVSNVENMSYLFCECYEFNGDISNWNVANVTLMRGIFSFAQSFNCNISGWNVSKVWDMSFIFNNCKSFDQDLSSWDISKLREHKDMFKGCNKAWTYSKRPKK